MVLQSETIAQACPDDFKDDLLPEERDELLRAQLLSERDVRVEAHAATEPSTADRFAAGRSHLRARDAMSLCSGPTVECTVPHDKCS